MATTSGGRPTPRRMYAREPDGENPHSSGLGVAGGTVSQPSAGNVEARSKNQSTCEGAPPQPGTFYNPFTTYEPTGVVLGASAARPASCAAAQERPGATPGGRGRSPLWSTAVRRAAYPRRGASPAAACRSLSARGRAGRPAKGSVARKPRARCAAAPRSRLRRERGPASPVTRVGSRWAVGSPQCTARWGTTLSHAGVHCRT